MFELTEVVERIERLCSEKGVDVKTMLLECQLSRSTVDNMKKGSKPSIDKIQPIAEYFGVTVDYLIGNSPVRHGSMDISKIDLQAELRPVPIVGNVAAGYSALAETNIIGYMPVEEEFLNDGYEYAWLRVKGDSMFPTIQEGDLVLVRLQQEVESGDLAVVIVDEEDGLIKRVKYSTNSVTLISDNPEYEDRVFKRKDMNRITIWGVPVEIRRRGRL